MKIKMFTHTDLDGIVCAIIMKYLCNGLNVELDIEYCDYNNINERVGKFLDNCNTIDYRKDYQNMFITDISINKEIAEKIEKVNRRYFIGIKLLDHHQTALWLNEYKWAKVEVIDEETKKKNSGTSMLFKYFNFQARLIKYLVNKNIDLLYLFAEYVRQYDTYEFKENNNIIPKQYNDLLNIYGREEFIKAIMFKLEVLEDLSISNSEELLLEINQNQINRYIEEKQTQIIRRKLLDYNIGVVFAERFVSELGNRLCENNKDLDFVVIIDMSKSVSYRGIREDINLGKDIATLFGGGGHIKAAGSEISDEIRNRIIDVIMEIK